MHGEGEKKMDELLAAVHKDEISANAQRFVS